MEYSKYPLRDIKTIGDVCDRIVRIRIVATKNNIYRVISYDNINGFCLENVDTAKRITATPSTVLKALSRDADGYDTYREVLPEYFV